MALGGITPKPKLTLASAFILSVLEIGILACSQKRANGFVSPRHNGFLEATTSPSDA